MKLEDDRIDEIARLMNAWEWTFAKGIELRMKWGISHEELIEFVNQAVPKAPKYEPLRVALARAELPRLDRIIALAKRHGAAEVVADAERSRERLVASVGEPGPLN
jgi:hypothetical protein